jgi:transcriptional regulator GlxA family with amidase domain
MPKPPPSKKRHIAILVFDNVELLDIAGPHEVFATALALADRFPPIYDVATAAARQGAVKSSSGLIFQPTQSIGDLAGLDTLLIAGGAGIHALCDDPDMVEWLKATAPKVRRIGAICTGAFLLAAAGLLDGRRAVTHWNWCDRLAARHGTIAVERDPIYVSDDGVWTSAGVTAGIDMALAMIEEDQGAKLALRTAQELVVFRKRPGGQSQFSASLALHAALEPPLDGLRDWILGHLDSDLSVSELAARIHMSPRNFSRVFERNTRASPAKFVELARLDAARRRLETTRDPVERIAAACGFASADVMARAMLRQLGVTPSDYRRRFNAAWHEDISLEA